jgi:tripartite-type tricarboxylate transporter receptor subunit TctC
MGRASKQARRVRSLAAGIAAWALLAGGTALAQTSYPTKPVKFIVSTPAGSSPDIIARYLGERLAKVFNQPVVVDNILGAGGLIASQTLVRSAPDGHTLYFSGTGALFTDRHTQKSPGYDAERDFILVAMLWDENSLTIAVHPDVPANDLAQLIAAAKKQPGKLTYGVTSVSLLLLFGDWFRKQAGVDMLPVTYKTAAQQYQDALAGRTHMIITSPAQVEPFRKAGKLRVLAIDGSRRLPSWPDVPNISETLPGWAMSGLGVLVAPRGTPAEVVQYLNRALDRQVREPDYVQRLLEMGFTVNGAGTPESIAAFVRAKRAYWDGVMKELDVRPE